VNLVFADAGYWVGLRSRTDANHVAAVNIAQLLVRQRTRIVVTPFVFAEVYAIFSRRPAVREQLVRDVWENPIVEIEQPTVEDQENALALLKRHADKSFSFTDALSFVVMTRLDVSKAVSFDEHFRQYGQFEIIDAA
jgi:predicted nucleic acid-binding protein